MKSQTGTKGVESSYAQAHFDAIFTVYSCFVYPTVYNALKLTELLHINETLPNNAAEQYCWYSVM